MISAARRHGVVQQIGFMRRFDRCFLEAKEKIDEGEIGRIVTIRSVGRGPGLPPKWACDPKTGIGMLAEVNSHDFDSIRWLVGSEFERVYAEADALLCPELKKEFPDFYDSAVVTLRFRDNTLGIVDGACPVHYGYDARVEVLGTEGALFIGEQRHKAVMVCTKEKRIIASSHPSWRDRFERAYLEEMRHFVDCVLHDKEPRVTWEDGKAALEIVLAANRSIKERKPIEIE